ncbi:hypothetical protein ACIO8G_18515 [Streptomyces sp. NPDC087219]|uniref:hypothetical protein n=1 Tax=Streptomyces sp. NPDC087219 TaxID=3365770 RepID=UPI0038221F8C
MARQHRRPKKPKPPFPLPEGLILSSTPDGWRRSLIVANGGIICGGCLPGVPADADPRDARAAAVLDVQDLARTLHQTEVDVVWEPAHAHAHASWTAQVRVIAGEGLSEIPSSPRPFPR